MPIATHNGPPTLGAEQQRVFKEEGCDLSRIVIGHVGDTDDTDYLKSLMDAGSYIGMDRFGLDMILSFEKRVGTVASLCADGYAERILLAHDATLLPRLDSRYESDAGAGPQLALQSHPR